MLVYQELFDLKVTLKKTEFSAENLSKFLK